MELNLDEISFPPLIITIGGKDISFDAYELMWKTRDLYENTSIEKMRSVITQALGSPVSFEQAQALLTTLKEYYTRHEVMIKKVFGPKLFSVTTTDTPSSKSATT